MSNNNKDLGKILKRQRILLSLTLRELAAESGVSSSHLGRIEQGQRFPSARVLRKLSKALSFDENELFILAGYLSNPLSNDDKHDVNSYQDRQLDPSVATMLSQEPVEVQRTMLGILSIIKYLANSSESHE